MRILCAGDLHLGRGSTRLPTTGDARTYSCAAAWAAIVDHAIAQQVDVVALSGDLVDQDNRFFEALGPLEKGLRRLAGERIVTVAVAGNHDYGVLPAHARQLDPAMFRLLGVGGRWERTLVHARDGLSALHVDGWSFPQQHVHESPLASYALPAATDHPVLGLLHCDLAPNSAYAPATLADLRARAASMWLIGHVHAPRLHHADGAAPVLYPGSPQPMDPGETGVHGAWIVELRAGVAPRPVQVPLATVRYETIDVEVSAAATIDEARALAAAAVRDRALPMVREGSGALRALTLRVRFVGRSTLHRALDGLARDMAADIELDVDGTSVFVERVTVLTQPARDLDAMANGSDAVALLARLLRDVNGALQAPEQDALLRALLAAPNVLRHAGPYRALHDDDALSPLVLRETLAVQARLLLDELLAQKEAPA